MRAAMVRYRVKPEHAAENVALVQAVYRELEQTQPDGLRYATFRLDDGVSFVHIAIEEDDGPGALTRLAAFQRFREGIAERCDEPPVAPSFRRSVRSGRSIVTSRLRRARPPAPHGRRRRR